MGARASQVFRAGFRRNFPVGIKSGTGPEPFGYAFAARNPTPPRPAACVWNSVDNIYIFLFRKMKAQTTSRHRPGAPRRTARAHRSAIVARSSPIADRRSPIVVLGLVRSFGSRTRMDCAGCCVCMCEHDVSPMVSPTSTVHHSRSRAVILHHTTHACAYHENLTASASCFMSTTSNSQGGRRPMGVQQHSAADGRTCGSEQESHPRRRSPERDL